MKCIINHDINDVNLSKKNKLQLNKSIKKVKDINNYSQKNISLCNRYVPSQNNKKTESFIIKRKIKNESFYHQNEIINRDIIIVHIQQKIKKLIDVIDNFKENNLKDNKENKENRIDFNSLFYNSISDEETHKSPRSRSLILETSKKFYKNNIISKDKQKNIQNVKQTQINHKKTNVVIINQTKILSNNNVLKRITRKNLQAKSKKTEKIDALKKDKESFQKTISTIKRKTPCKQLSKCITIDIQNKKKQSNSIHNIKSKEINKRKNNSDVQDEMLFKTNLNKTNTHLQKNLTSSFEHFHLVSTNNTEHKI